MARPNGCAGRTARRPRCGGRVGIASDTSISRIADVASTAGPIGGRGAEKVIWVQRQDIV